MEINRSENANTELLDGMKSFTRTLVTMLDHRFHQHYWATFTKGKGCSSPLLL